MKKFTLFLFAFTILNVLSGCSHFTNTQYWNYQKITLFTHPRSSICTLYNNRGIWQIKSTPQTLLIHRSKAPLHVFCHKPGYVPTNKLVKSHAPIMRKGTLEPDYYPTDDDYNYFYPKFINLSLRVKRS